MVELKVDVTVVDLAVKTAVETAEKLVKKWVSLLDRAL